MGFSIGFNWKMIVVMLLPMLEAAGHAKQNEDDNDTGKDDAIGISLLYAAQLLKALINNEVPPRAPDILK